MAKAPVQRVAAPAVAVAPVTIPAPPRDPRPPESLVQQSCLECKYPNMSAAATICPACGWKVGEPTRAQRAEMKG